MDPLPEPLYACELLCRICRTGLLYQRQERPRFPRPFLWCPRCSRKYAAAESWSPAGGEGFGAGSTDVSRPAEK